MEEGEWRKEGRRTPDEHEGYFFLPSDIQITRAEGVLHLMQK